MTVLRTLTLCALLITAVSGCAKSPAIHSTTQAATTVPATRPAATGQIAVEVVRADSGRPMTAWVQVQAGDDKNINGTYKGGPKGFVCPKATTVTVPAGEVTVSAWSHVAFEQDKRTLSVRAGEVVPVKLALRPRFDPHQLGFVTSDSHNHLNKGTKPSDVVDYCRAAGIDHVDVCQGWMTTNSATYADIIKLLKDSCAPDVSFAFGAESPKLRYGHTWYVNHPGLADPHGDYLKWHDSAYFKAEGRDATKNPPMDLRGEFRSRWRPPFVDRTLARKKGAFATVAHPTSWWHNNPTETYPATNIAVDLAFDLLVAQSYDGIVVMGYDHDHLFYQYIWFNLMDRGYRLTPMAESDGNTETGSLGRNLTYTYTGKSAFDMADLVRNLKAGHTTLSGKAFMRLTVDGSLPAGTALPADGKKHTLDVDVYSESDPEEYISWLVLYRNGEVAGKVDLRGRKPRHIKHTFTVKETGTAYYVVKCYGKTYPKNDLQFDVRAYVNECMKESHSDYKKNTGVAIAAPVYFNGPDYHAPEKLISHILGQIVDASGEPLPTTVEVWNVDEKLAELKTDAAGRFQIDAPATIDVRFTTPDGKAQQQWLFYEYPPLLDLMEDCYTIAWAKKYPSLSGGQMPWSAFHFDEIRDVLKDVNWTIKAK